MCNLYRLSVPLAEISALFDAASAPTGANLPAETYPGSPGIVIAAGQVRSMVWGFPLALTGKQGQPLKPKPVNNARSDKLDSAFWRASFASRRCLIPLTAWAEAEGPQGAKTRTWLSLPDQPVFACAGIWQPTAPWGDSYAMIMTDAVGAAATCHTRMPVILAQQDWQAWLDTSPEQAWALCVPYRGAIAIARTATPWAAPRSPRQASARTGTRA